MTAARGRGPLPARPPTQVLPASRLRVLRAVGRHEPVTTTELSSVLGSHENTTRQHLEALARDGLVSGEQNRGRMGRPSVAFSVSANGLLHLAGQVASREHTALVATLADHLAATSDDASGDARRLGVEWGRRLAEVALANGGDAEPDDLTRALDVLEGLGFSPTVDDDRPRAATPGADGGSDLAQEAAVVLRTCPLLDAAREHPGVVCTVHEGLVEGYLAAHGSDARVDVAPFADRLGCRAVIRS